ncbi:MAG: malto-oligosyltrehalose synthase [Pirellulales bacterium]|nr:malto-oligosyltrehalose synthase [Pirellulales bacterium]
MAINEIASTALESPAAELAAAALRRRVDPGATYRLQLHAQFDFDRAAAIAPYLRALGVTHVYASPILQARAGSEHGYDVCDHDQIDRGLGGAAGFARLSDSLAAAGLALLLDVVPNHMSTDTSNPWWHDVLENGPNSPYAHYFDIDWHPVKTELANKVLLPILGKQYGEVLEAGELRIEHHDGGFTLRYFDNVLPLGPKTAIPLLTNRREVLEATLADDCDSLNEFQSIVTALEHLPSQNATWPEAIAERQREKEVIKRRLRDLEASSATVAQFVARNVELCNGTADDPASFDQLDAIISAQAYRLSNWRAATDEINYRRFFDINSLAAVSMELPEVFRRTHRVLFELVARGQVAGLRIDHIDGLFAPEQYLWRLQWAYLAVLAELRRQRHGAPAFGDVPDAPATTAPRAPLIEADKQSLDEACALLGFPRPEAADLTAIYGADAAPATLPRASDAAAESSPLDKLDPDTVAAEAQSAVAGANGTTAEVSQPLDLADHHLPLFVVVEKILGPHEPLPPTWPVAGTTGYDFMHQVGGQFLDPQGWKSIVQFYRRAVGEARTFDEVVRDSKRLILRSAMASELQMLAHQLNRISEQHRRSRDFTLNVLRYALREILMCFPVYRIYPNPRGVGDRDRHFVNLAAALAKRRNPDTDWAVFDFIRDVLLLNHPPGLTDPQRRDREHFAGRFQQVTSPVMGKGFEDTAYYVYCPLVSVNEVGGEPQSPVVTPAAFHDVNARRCHTFPWAMLASTTHDSKRSEDVRARLHVLSELPQAWRNHVNRWFRTNRVKRSEIDGQPAPSRNDEYLFYQSLLGIWPLEPPDEAQQAELVARLQRYMEKATHEAKQHTSWINPNERYDRAVRDFVAATLEPSPGNRFLAQFRDFHAAVAAWGLVNSLGQLVLKLTSPGVPDLYQGQELWDFSLVDPDNRRPVDFELRRRLLADINRAVADAAGLRALAAELATSLADPRTKLFVTSRLLERRRRTADLFVTGEYRAVDVTGPAAEHVIAFARIEKPDGVNTGQRAARVVLVVVPRFLVRLTQSAGAVHIAPPPKAFDPALWGDTSLDGAALGEVELENVFTSERVRAGASVPVAQQLCTFPVAVLASVES